MKIFLGRESVFLQPACYEWCQIQANRWSLALILKLKNDWACPVNIWITVNNNYIFYSITLFSIKMQVEKVLSKYELKSWIFFFSCSLSHIYLYFEDKWPILLPEYVWVSLGFRVLLGHSIWFRFIFNDLPPFSPRF